MTRAGTSTKNGFVSLCREIFSRFVEQHFPTVINNAVGQRCQPRTDDICKTMLGIL